MKDDYSLEAIAAEYDEASSASDEHGKVKWSSQQSMENRFKFAASRISFEKVRSWLDVGSGTGAFQAIIIDKFPALSALGIDVSSGLVAFAHSRPDTGKAQFRVQDFSSFEGETFDLITCIGVLQKSNISLPDFFRKAFQASNPGGTVYIDTMNLSWRRFQEPNFFPEKSHRWFDPSEVRDAAIRVGFRVEELGGVDIPNVAAVHIEASHSMYMIGVRP